MYVYIYVCVYVYICVYILNDQSQLMGCLDYQPNGGCSPSSFLGKLPDNVEWGVSSRIEMVARALWANFDSSAMALAEATLLKRLQHPNVLKYYEHFTHYLNAVPYPFLCIRCARCVSCENEKGLCLLSKLEMLCFNGGGVFTEGPSVFFFSPSRYHM